MSERGFFVAVVGATGAVGQEMLRVLERRRFPVRGLRLLASARSAGKELEFAGERVRVEELGEGSFEGVELALFSAGGGVSRRFGPVAVRAGALVVDNSSAFRLEEGVPLVVPEVNGEAVRGHRGLIANPNCTTAITLMALGPLHREFGVRRVIASSYQAVSGTGAQALEELERQVRDWAAGREPVAEVYPYVIAGNVIPQVDEFLESGYTREEMKMQYEARKILGVPELKASVTCVRVPVRRSHAVAVTAEFEREVCVRRAREVLEEAPGLEVVDDPGRRLYPMPIWTSGRDECAVGRLRRDCALENGLSFWVCGDQLLKGAALNAVQIAELALLGGGKDEP